MVRVCIDILCSIVYGCYYDVWWCSILYYVVFYVCSMGLYVYGDALYGMVLYRSRTKCNVW